MLVLSKSKHDLHHRHYTRNLTMRPTLSRLTASVVPDLKLSLKIGTETYKLAISSGIARHLPSQASSSRSSEFSSNPPLGLALATPHVVGEEVSSAWSEKVAEIGSALWNGILLAAPKSKTSHSRKRMRSANKGLKDRTDMVHCSACGKPKLFHHICPSCYFELARFQKVTQRLQVPTIESNTTATPVARGHAEPQKSLNPSVSRQSTST